MKTILAALVATALLGGAARAAAPCTNGDEAQAHLVQLEHAAMMELLARKLDGAKFSELFNQKLADLNEEVDSGDPATACQDIDAAARTYGVTGAG